MLIEWSQTTRKCTEKMKQKKPKELEMCLNYIIACTNETPIYCRYQKYSLFEEAGKDIFKIIENDCKVPDEKCKLKNGFKSLQQCIKLFFQYYANLHHLHYNKQSLEKQLVKTRLCLKSELKQCSPQIVMQVFRILGGTYMIEIPDTSGESGEITTRVTYPNENVVCSTRFWPLPTSVYSQKRTPQISKHKPTKSPYNERRYPTTKRYTHYKVPGGRRKVTYPQPTTKKVSHGVPRRGYTGVMRPTPVKHRYHTISVGRHHVTMQPVTPSIVSQKPSHGGYTHNIKPTKTQTHEVPVPTHARTAKENVPYTVTKWNFPGPIRYGKHITPTHAYFRRNTPPTRRGFNKHELPTTEIGQYTPQTKRGYHYHIYLSRPPSFHRVTPSRKSWVTKRGVPPTRKIGVGVTPKIYYHEITPHPGIGFKQTAPPHHIHIHFPQQPTSKVRITPKKATPRRMNEFKPTPKQKKVTIHIHVHFGTIPLTTSKYRIHQLPTKQGSRKVPFEVKTTKARYAPKHTKHYHIYIKGSTVKSHNIPIPTKGVIHHVPMAPTRHSVYTPGKGGRKRHETYGKTTAKYMERVIKEYHHVVKHRPNKRIRYVHHIAGSNYTEIIHIKTPGVRRYTPPRRRGYSDTIRRTTGVVIIYQPTIHHGVGKYEVTTKKYHIPPIKRRTPYQQIIRTTKVYTHHIYLPTHVHKGQSPQVTTEVYHKTPKGGNVYGWFPAPGSKIDITCLIELTKGKCKYPVSIECRSASPKNKNKDKVTCDIYHGFSCEGKCENYEIKLICCDEEMVEECPWKQYHTPIGKFTPVEKITKDCGKCNSPVELECELVKVKGMSKSDVNVVCNVLQGVACMSKKQSHSQNNCMCSVKVRLVCCQCERTRHEHIMPPQPIYIYHQPPVYRDHRTVAVPKTFIYHVTPGKPRRTGHWKPSNTPRVMDVPMRTQTYGVEKPITSIKIVIIIPGVSKITGKEVVPPTSVYKHTPRQRHYYYNDTHQPATTRNFDVKIPSIRITGKQQLPTTSIYQQSPGRKIYHYWQRRKDTTNGSVDIQPPVWKVTGNQPVPPTSIYKRPAGKIHFHYHNIKRHSTHGGIDVQPPIWKVTGNQPAPYTSIHKIPPRRRYTHYYNVMRPTTVRGFHIHIHPHTYKGERPGPLTTIKKYKPTKHYYIYRRGGTTSRSYSIRIPTRHNYIQLPKNTPSVNYQPQKPYYFYIRKKYPTTVRYFRIPFSPGVVTRYIPGTTRKYYYRKIPTRKVGTVKEAPPTKVIKKTPAYCEYYTTWCKMPNTAPISVIIKRVGKCQHPVIIECRSSSSKQDHTETKDKVTCNIREGFRCEGKCQHQYEVRLMCCNSKYIMHTPWLTYTAPVGKLTSIDKILTDCKTCLFPIKLSCEIVKVHGVKKGDVTVTCDVHHGIACVLKKSPDNQFEECKCALKVQVECCQCGHFEYIPVQTTKSVRVPVKPHTYGVTNAKGATKIIHHNIPGRTHYHDVLVPQKPKVVTYIVTRIHRKKIVPKATTKKYGQRPPKRPPYTDHEYPPTSHHHIYIRTRNYTDTYPGRLTTSKIGRYWVEVPPPRYGYRTATTRISHQTPRYRPPWIYRKQPTRRPYAPTPHRPITHQFTQRRGFPPTKIIRKHPTRGTYHRRIGKTTHKVRTVPITRSHHYVTLPQTPVETNTHNTKHTRRYHHHWTPSTVRFYRGTPPIRHGRHSPNVPATTRIHAPTLHTRIYTRKGKTVGTSKIIHTATGRNYCDWWNTKSPKKSTVTCYKVQKPKEICTSEWLNKWRSRIRSCVMDRLRRRGNCLDKKPITKECLKKLRCTLIICLRIIGDTLCRAKLNLIELIMEKDIIVIGRISEKVVPGGTTGGGGGGKTPGGKRRTPGVKGSTPGSKGRTPMLKSTTREMDNANTSRCIRGGDSGKINNCYPGLYQVLVAIFILGKGSAALELHNANSNCLSKALQHCSKDSLQELKKLIEGMFGVCIIPVPNQPCKSDSMGFKSLDSPYCEQSQIQKFTQNLESCLEQSYEPKHFKQLLLAKKLAAIDKCISMRTLDCVFSKWETFLEILSFICHVVRETPRDKHCTRAFTVSNFKECSQNLISVTSALHDIKHGIDQNVMKTIKECYMHSLEDCPPEVSEAFLTLLESLTNTAYLSEGEELSDESSEEFEDKLPLRERRHITLSSIKVTSDGVKICEQTEQEDSDEFDPGTPAKDICEPLRSFENDDSQSTTYILQKSCRSYDIVTWIDSLKKCVGEITHNIAMEDPDSLTIDRVLNIFRDCLKEQEQLKCRPKVQKTFKLFLRSVLNTLRVMSIKSGAESCHDDLAIENIATCVNHLHMYLVVKYHASVLRNEEAKSLECLKKTCNHCDLEFLEGVLITLDESINKNKDAIDDSNPEYTVCEPDDPEYNRMADLCQGLQRERAPPTQRLHINILKKALETEHSDSLEDDYDQLDIEDDSYYYQPTMEYEPLFNDYEVDSTKEECDFHQYMKYLEIIFECQHLRMETLIYFKGTYCELNWTEKALESLVKCVLENRESKLPCRINDPSQVKEYLTDLSVKLDANRKYKGKGCPRVESCFETEAPVLSKCSNAIYRLLNSSEYEMTSNGRKQTSAIFKCLKSIWPDCAPSVSLLSLPSIYVPLGISLNDVIKETQDEVCLSAKISSTDRKYTCLSYEKETATKNMYECLERITKRLKEIIHKKNDKLPWQIIPFTVCVTTHPILECRLKDYGEFVAFMQNFLRQIKVRLRKFVELFEDDADIELGEKCLQQFSAPQLDKCLSLMFGFMESFHRGNIKASDYPSQCVEEIFGICGDIPVFHMFMKKSMNISEEIENVEKQEMNEEVCINIQQDDYALHPCTFSNFVKSLPDPTECVQGEIEDEDTNIHHLVELCKDCILRNAEEMCFYDLPDLKRAVGASLSTLSKCLNSFDIKDHCLHDLVYEVKNQCISDFHAYAFNIKNGTVVKAIHLAKEFYHCMERAVKSCPANTYKAIFNLYSRISGLENFSKYKKSNILYDAPA